MALSSINLRLSAMRALFEKIKPNLRMASVAELEGKIIRLTFCYDGEITDEEEDLAGDAGTEVIADFPQEHLIEWDLIRCDYPEKIPSLPGYVVYARYEKH